MIPLIWAETDTFTCAAAETAEQESYAGLVINEVCSSNKKSFVTDNGTSPDWIEIYNSGDEAICLSGIGLSDSNKNRFKYVFPEDAVLHADSFCIVLCSETDSSSGGDYAAFNISASGETIYLTANDGTDIDSVKIPALAKDITYGRYPDGSGSFSVMEPSPGTNNIIPMQVNAPVFSAEGGFYDEAFSLSLSDEDGHTILYTLDGSDPRTSVTSMEYQEPISIYDNTDDPNILSAYENITLKEYTAPQYNVDKGIVVRAVCVEQSDASEAADGDRFSKVVTNNYFINKNASYYKDTKVLAISTDSDNFFHDDYGIYVVGSQYEAWKNSDAFRPNLNISSASNPTNYNMKGKEWERPCNIQVFENGNLQYTEDVGVRIFGQWSTASPQKSMTLYARSEYGASKMQYDFFDGAATDMDGAVIDEFKRVTMRSGGRRIRDTINAEIAEGLNFGTQTKSSFIVFIDGEFWGHYFAQEKLDDHYLESHYKLNSDDVTIIKNGKLDAGSESVYQEYEDFWKWAMSADMSDASNYQRVCDTMDIQSYIDFIAFEDYIINYDCIFNPNNWRIWRSNNIEGENIYADGKWRFLLFDTDISCGSSSKCSLTIDTFQGMDRSGTLKSISSLFYRLMDNAAFREAFYQRFHEIAATNFDLANVDPILDRLDSTIGDAALASSMRYNDSINFHSTIKNIRTFFRKRGTYAFQHLDAFYENYNTAPETTTTTPVPISALRGDINEDLEVDVADAVLLARFLAEDETVVITTQGQKNADCNDSGSPDHDDLVMILKSIARLITL